MPWGSRTTAFFAIRRLNSYGFNNRCFSYDIRFQSSLALFTVFPHACSKRIRVCCHFLFGKVSGRYAEHWSLCWIRTTLYSTERTSWRMCYTFYKKATTSKPLVRCSWRSSPVFHVEQAPCSFVSLLYCSQVNYAKHEAHWSQPRREPNTTLCRAPYSFLRG